MQPTTIIKFAFLLKFITDVASIAHQYLLYGSSRFCHYVVLPERRKKQSHNLLPGLPAISPANTKHTATAQVVRKVHHLSSCFPHFFLFLPQWQCYKINKTARGMYEMRALISHKPGSPGQHTKEGIVAIQQQ